jgi:diguanylate cyclase (GGDEF)-like protein
VRQAPDHYALLDRNRIGRLAGVLACCAGLLSAALLAVDPPTAALGDVGWVPAGLILSLTLVFGAAMVRTTRNLGTGTLLAVALSGPIVLAALQWLAGPASSFVQLLVLSAVWSGFVLPARRLLIVLFANTLVVVAPAAYGEWSADLLPQCIATLGIVWMLSLLSLVWSDRLRDIRRGLNAQRVAADELARVDALTGLGNRRALDEALVVEIATAHRRGRPVAALVGDLDGFKTINDVHGHRTGDRLLRAVAAVLRETVRSPDACFRWGGDEFVVLLGDADEAAAGAVAERVADAIRDRCATPDGEPVTMTIGAAAHNAGAVGADLLAEADDALLAAKYARVA